MFLAVYNFVEFENAINSAFADVSNFKASHRQVKDSDISSSHISNYGLLE